MDTKLQALIDRLETVVKRAEAAQGTSSTPTQVVANSGSPATVSPLVKEWINDVQSKIKPLSDAANALNIPQITTATNQFISLIYLQPAVLMTLAKFSKPQDLSFLGAKMGEISQAVELVLKKDFKSPRDHLQTVISGLQMFSYPFYDDEAIKDVMTSHFEEVSFPGNKVLKLGKDLDTKWVNSFKDICTAIHTFILKNLKTVNKWSGSEDQAGAQVYLASITEEALSGKLPTGTGSSSSSSAPVQVSAPTAQPTQVPANAPAGNSLASSYQTQVVSLLKAFKDAAAALNVAQVVDATERISGLIEEQYLIFNLMAKFQKPTQMQFLLKRKEEVFNALSLVKQKDFKAPPNHLQTLIDGIGLFGIVFMTPDDEMKEFLKEIFGGIPFYGNKVLKLDKPVDTAWYNAYIAVAEAHYKFVISNLSSVTKWTGTESVGLESAFNGGVVAAPVQAVQAAPAAPKKEETKVAVAPAKKVQRPSSRVLTHNKWVCENFLNENLLFEGEEQCNKSIIMNFFACQNSEINVVGKVKSILIEGCKKVTLYVDTVVSEVSVMNCSDIKIFGKVQLNMVSIESTNGAQVNLTHATKKCKVATTCTRSVWIRFPKNGADETDNDNANWVKLPVAEIYETQIQANDSVETKPTESLE